MLRQWLGMELSDLSIEDYVYWGGVVQGAGLAEYIKNFRRRMFDSAAAVFWMYNDCWPAVRSWTVVDYYLRRTPTFWAVRRYLAPVAVCVVREDDQVRVYGINEGGRLTAKLRYGIMKLAGGYPMDASADVVLEPNSSTKLVEFSAAEWDALGVDSHVAFALLTRDGVELARDTLLLPLFKEVRWPEADVRVTVTNGEARFECDTLAWQVCLDMDGEEALGDNFFDVYPGVPTVLPWPESRGAPQVRRTGNELGRRLQA
jgi:beta-mannosidase